MIKSKRSFHSVIFFASISLFIANISALGSGLFSFNLHVYLDLTFTPVFLLQSLFLHQLKALNNHNHSDLLFHMHFIKK